MSNAIAAWIIFAIISMVYSYFLHRLLKRFVVACVVASLLAAATFQVVVYLELGYWDKFWPIAAFITFLISLAISVVVGIAFRKLISKRKDPNGQAVP